MERKYVFIQGIEGMGDKVIKVKSGKIDSISINENPMDVDRIEY